MRSTWIAPPNSLAQSDLLQNSLALALLQLLGHGSNEDPTLVVYNTGPVKQGSRHGTLATRHQCIKAILFFSLRRQAHSIDGTEGAGSAEAMSPPDRPLAHTSPARASEVIAL